MREFVTEQYLSAACSDVAASRASAARRAAEQLTSEGMPVHFVRSIFIPEDETCLHLYRAESIDAVRAAATRASLALDRIAEAVSDSGSRRNSAWDAARTQTETSDVEKEC
ncbi:MAG: nickel-binding protein [Solirubrobacteraceae bacterium]